MRLGVVFFFVNISSEKSIIFLCPLCLRPWTWLTWSTWTTTADHMRPRAPWRLASSSSEASWPPCAPPWANTWTSCSPSRTTCRSWRATGQWPLPLWVAIFMPSSHTHTHTSLTTQIYTTQSMLAILTHTLLTTQIYTTQSMLAILTHTLLTI